MKNTIALMMIGFILCSCESDDITNSKKLITESIDINSDSKPDFKLEYYELATTDIPSSAGEKFGEITPIDENLILYDENNGYLFLQVGDVIKKSVSENQRWSPNGAGVISKKRREQEYDEFWTIRANSSNNYYLGIKLKNGSSEEIGWVKLDFNTDTGEVYLLDSHVSSSNEITITD